MGSTFAFKLLGGWDRVGAGVPRSEANPNQMWKGHELAVLDHEKVFGYLKLAEGEAKPWRRFGMVV